MAPARWDFFPTKVEALAHAQAAMHEDEWDTAKVFEQTFIESFQNRAKLDHPSPHEKKKPAE